jgi:nucleoside-diphosphate-sugar epimerase
MNVLLTGSSGFFGQIVMNRLLYDYDVYSLSRSSSYFNCDLSQSIPFFNFRFDLVIHAAGKAHCPTKTKDEYKSFFDVNYTGTQNLLKSLESLDQLPKSFVFISSVAVYGREVGTNISENMSLLAQDPYGLSKIQAEQLVENWCLTNNVVCTILRLPLLLGQNPPGNLGSMLKAIKSGYYFNIGGGRAKKSMVLAEDVARFIPIIALVGGTYNLTDGEHPCFADLSSAIAKKEMNNLPLVIAKIMGCVGDVLGEKSPINSNKIKKITSDLTFDDMKARELGWNPQSVLEYLESNNL